jgi:hypothetical protein
VQPSSGLRSGKLPHRALLPEGQQSPAILLFLPQLEVRVDDAADPFSSSTASGALAPPTSVCRVRTTILNRRGGPDLGSSGLRGRIGFRGTNTGSPAGRALRHAFERHHMRGGALGCCVQDPGSAQISTIDGCGLRPAVGAVAREPHTRAKAENDRVRPRMPVPSSPACRVALRSAQSERRPRDTGPFLTEERPSPSAWHRRSDPPGAGSRPQPQASLDQSERLGLAAANSASRSAIMGEGRC